MVTETCDASFLAILSQDDLVVDSIKIVTGDGRLKCVRPRRGIGSSGGRKCGTFEYLSHLEKVGVSRPRRIFEIFGLA